MNMDMILVTLC